VTTDIATNSGRKPLRISHKYGWTFRARAPKYQVTAGIYLFFLLDNYTSLDACVGAHVLDATSQCTVSDVASTAHDAVALKARQRNKPRAPLDVKLNCSDILLVFGCHIEAQHQYSGIVGTLDFHHNIYSRHTKYCSGSKQISVWLSASSRCGGSPVSHHIIPL
jgi:hypothetical protein